MTSEGETFLRSVADVVGIQQCLQAYGVVGVTGVLTKEECEDTLRDMGMPAAFNIRDPATYDLPEVHAALNPYGVVGSNVLWTPTLLRNRCHPLVVQAYRAAYGSEGSLCTQRLLACHDRAAIMRPTGGAGGAAMDTAYHYPGLHLDVDPQSFCSEDRAVEAKVRAFLDGLMYGEDRDFIAENNAKTFRMRHYQGVLNLINNREGDGGFHCVPMADPTAWLQKWVKEHVWTRPPEPNGR
jgi:hypothetical protein